MAWTLPVLAGLTAVVNRNCVLKLAVYVVADAGVVTVCDCAPPSFQLANTERVVPEP